MRGIYLFFVLALTVVLFSFNSLHPTGNTNAPGDSFCGNCHGGTGGTLDGDINVTGLPGTIMPSTTYQLTVTVSNPTLNANKAGFQILVLDETNSNAGTMANNSGSSAFRTNTANGRVYLGHNPATTFGGNPDITWTTDWTSPSAGNTITVYAAAVIANGNGANSGDLSVFNTASAPMSGGGTPLSVIVTEDSPTSCFDTDDGAATATPMGGMMPYSFAWDNGEMTAQAVALSPGFHEVTVTDDASNNVIADVFINSPTEVVASIDTQEDVKCFDGNDGFAIIQATGGSPGYNFQWSDGGSGAMRTDLIAGLYQVTATDINNCEGVVSVSIDEPLEITVTETISEVSCNNEIDGSIMITPDGGTGSYTFAWSNGSSDQNLTNIGAGVYGLTITDNNQCQKMFQYELINPPAISVTVQNILDALCNGEASGEAEVQGQGGTGNLSYNWSDSGTGPIRNDLLAGQYTVSVIDENGCFTTDIVIVNEPDAIQLDSTDAVNASCTGVMDGALEVDALGGSGTISFLWSNSATTARIENIAAGVYTVTATDNNDCSTSISLTLGANSGATLTAGSSSMVTCNGGSDGSAMVTIQDGTGYTIEWSNGIQGPMLNNLSAGQYTATASNSSGCISNDVTITISEPSAIGVDSATINHPLCNDDNSGSISLFANGGTGALSYVWSNGDTTSTITGLQAGQYIVQLTDQNNCVVSDTFVLVNPPAITIDSLSITDALCVGDSSGMIILYATGGTGNLTYLWTNGSTSDTLTNLSKGDYIVEISDDNNCIARDTISISEPDQITATATIMNETAQGLSDGYIKVVASGGAAGYSFDWSNGSMIDSIGGLSPGIYSLTITDMKGCQNTFSYPISDGNCALVATVETTDISCFGFMDGIIVINTENELGTVTFTSSPSIPNLDSVGSGTYEIIVSDTAGCNVILSDVEISEPDQITATATITEVSAQGLSDGSIKVVPSGGTASYSFEWSNGEMTDSIGGLSADIYDLTITDANGCEAVFSYPILDGNCALIATFVSTNVSCFGLMDGTITINTENELGTVTYMSAPAIANLDSIGAGTYDITISDTAGCSVLLSDIFVTEPTALSVTVDEIIPSNGTDNGMINITPDGGTQPYAYNWLDEDGQTVSDLEDPDNLSPGIYMLLFTDANGCSITIDTVEVTLNSSVDDLYTTIKVYPNPTIDQLSISSTFIIQGYKIINAHGNLIESANYEFTRQAIDVSLWSEGVYLVQLNTGKSWINKRIVIMH